MNLRLSSRAGAPLDRLPELERRPLREASSERRVFMTDLQQAVPVLERESLSPGVRIDGPCVVVDKVATAWVAPGWSLAPDPWGNLVLERLTGSP